MKHKLILLAIAAAFALDAAAQAPAPRSKPAPAPGPAPAPAPKAVDPFGAPVPAPSRTKRTPPQVNPNAPAPRARPRVILPPTSRSTAEDPFGGPRAAPAPRTARHPSDPFAPASRGAPRLAANPGPKGPAHNLNVRYEVFSLGMADAASLMRANHPDQLLYTALLSLVDEKKAAQETLMSLTLRSGERAIAESIGEHIYPTEYEKPNIPTAYETRNFGVTLEAEAIIDPQTMSIDLSIAPEHVHLAGTSKWGPPDAQQEMPEWEVQKIRTTTQVTLDSPRLLGTVNRPPLSKLQKDGENRIWIAFATVSHVK